MLLSKKPFGYNNEFEKLEITYSDNSTDEYYINPREIEPSMEIKVQIQNAFLQLKPKSKIKSAQIYTWRDGYRTNTRKLKLK